MLQITDGIEVTEHTEPQERLAFLRAYRVAQESSPGEVARIEARLTTCALLARQAE